MHPEDLERLAKIKWLIESGENVEAYKLRSNGMFPEFVLDHLNLHKGDCPFCFREGRNVASCQNDMIRRGSYRWICTRPKGHNGPCVACFRKDSSLSYHNLTLVDWVEAPGAIELPTLPNQTYQPLEI